MFQKIINLEYTFPPGFPSDAQDLVSKLLVRSPSLLAVSATDLSQVLDPLSRLGGGPDGISAIKSHPFFTSSPSIDFSTIWTSAPPEIETGLAQPKKEERGEFVMPEGLEGFVSEEGEISDEEGPRGRGGEGSGTTGSGSPMGEVVREVPRVEPATKWCVLFAFLEVRADETQDGNPPSARDDPLRFPRPRSRRLLVEEAYAHPYRLPAPHLY